MGAKRGAATIVVLERGNICFTRRPWVEREIAAGPEDVQRLFIVIEPETSTRAGADFARQIIGRRRPRRVPPPPGPPAPRPLVEPRVEGEWR